MSILSQSLLEKQQEKMIEVLEGNGAFMDYMDGSMNNKIRNAASHSGGVYYDPITQHIECHYDATDDSKGIMKRL